MDFCPEAVTNSSSLGEHRPPCSMTPTTSKAIKKQTYFPGRFITYFFTIFAMNNVSQIKST